MQWLKNKYCSHQYYKISSEGEQWSMYDKRPEAYILHIYREDGNLKYHFVSRYHSYVRIVPYQVIGLSIGIRSRTYLLPAMSFILKGNNLFDRPILRWLCTHYLGIMPADTCRLVAIDDCANLYSGERLVVNTTLENDIK